MYRCNVCGSTGIRPGYVYEEGCTAEVCRSCGSDDIRLSRVNCSVCGEPVYEGEDAYRIGGTVVCTGCVTEITV